MSLVHLRIKPGQTCQHMHTGNPTKPLKRKSENACRPKHESKPSAEKSQTRRNDANSRRSKSRSDSRRYSKSVDRYGSGAYSSNEGDDLHNDSRSESNTTVRHARSHYDKSVPGFTSNRDNSRLISRQAKQSYYLRAVWIAPIPNKT